VVAALLGVALLATACGGGADGDADAEPSAPAGTEGRVATSGDTVQVHYHGTLDSGEVFDSSRKREPLSFTLGTGQVIAGFDGAVEGLAIGESVTVRLEPAEAYGERDDRKELTVPRAGAPEGLAVGDRVQIGNGAPAIVLELTENEIRVDANHPLAGMALTFEIELVAVE